MSSSRFVVASFLILLVLSLLLVVQIFWSLITPIIFALVLLSIFFPLYRSILNIVKERRLLAATLCVTIIFLIVFVPLGFFISKLGNQALYYYEQANSSGLFRQFLGEFSNEHPLIKWAKDLALHFGITISSETLVDTLKEFIRNFSQLIYSALSQIASNSLIILLNIVLTFVILFALFVTGKDLKNYLMQLAPLPLDEQERLMRQFGEISRAVFLGNGVINLLEGIFGGLGIYWFGIGPGTFWGVLIGLAAFIPGIGAWIIVGPAALYLLIEGHSDLALLYFIFNAVGFGVLEFILKPKFIGGKSRLHTVLVLLSILGGVQVFGVFGVFYGPMVVTMFLSLAEIYKEHYRSLLVGFEPKVFEDE